MTKEEGEEARAAVGLGLWGRFYHGGDDGDIVVMTEMVGCYGGEGHGARLLLESAQPGSDKGMRRGDQQGEEGGDWEATVDGGGGIKERKMELKIRLGLGLVKIDLIR